MNRAGSRISAAAAATALECLEDLCILAYRPAPERELHSAIAEMTSTITGWESAALVHADADRTRTLAAVGDRTAVRRHRPAGDSGADVGTRGRWSRTGP
ncbi:MAG: hypothetical protein R2878_08720 [Thermoleophilia bacterium]